MTDVSLKYLVLPRVELGVWSHTWGCRSCLCRGHAIGHMKFWLISLRTASALWLYLSIDCRCHKNSRKKARRTLHNMEERERRTENGKLWRIQSRALCKSRHATHTSLCFPHGTERNVPETCQNLFLLKFFLSNVFFFIVFFFFRKLQESKQKIGSAYCRLLCGRQHLHHLQHLQ